MNFTFFPLGFVDELLLSRVWLYSAKCQTISTKTDKRERFDYVRWWGQTCAILLSITPPQLNSIHHNNRLIKLYHNLMPKTENIIELVLWMLQSFIALICLNFIVPVYFLSSEIALFFFVCLFVHSKKCGSYSKNKMQIFIEEFLLLYLIRMSFRFCHISFALDFSSLAKTTSRKVMMLMILWISNANTHARYKFKYSKFFHFCLSPTHFAMPTFRSEIKREKI